MTTATELRPPGTEGPPEDRAALITGGTRGIGAAISRCLATGGAETAAGHWRQSGPAEKFMSRVSAVRSGRWHRTDPGRHRRPRPAR
jgi:acetoacetyl-CoA reductase/3-oxoacyl-[acyl-carrier protein] reductase